MSAGLIVTAVKRAIALEVEQGARSGLAIDRMWMWQVCDLKSHPAWDKAVNRAMTNHFLAVHRENRIGRFGQVSLLLVRRAGLVEGGTCRMAAGAPARPARRLTASDTTPLSRNLRLLGASGQGRGRGDW